MEEEDEEEDDDLQGDDDDGEGNAQEKPDWRLESQAQIYSFEIVPSENALRQR